MNRLTRFAWLVLVFNVGVILLGALVRATGSGAGCGRSWPTCHGELVPELSGATAIEFTHRSASGVALVLVAVLGVWAWRSAPSGGQIRTGVKVAVAAIVGEALIGAMIVLAEWVADDASVARAVAVPLHLVNTLLLLAALSLIIFWLGGGGHLSIGRHRGTWRWVLIGGIALVAISATGAITALADTLFPKDGIGIDLEAGSHFLTQLRIIHPVLAVLTAGIAWWKIAHARVIPGASPVVWLVGAMLVTGSLNVALGVPVWMQLVHLGLADALWIAYVFVAARALSASDQGTSVTA
ncbi:MAG: COX15/CtaA family protein [Acidimicrobiia bacterium]|nr:COX15/CtaA family protein [Acidimicrobiia bacterium]